MPMLTTAQYARAEIDRKLREMLSEREKPEYKSDVNSRITDTNYEPTVEKKYHELLVSQREKCESIKTAFELVGSPADPADTAMDRTLQQFLYDIQRLERPVVKWIAFCEIIDEISAWLHLPVFPSDAVDVFKRAAAMIPHLFDPLASDQDQQGSAKHYFTVSSQLAALVLEAEGTAYDALDVLMYGRGVIADAQIEKRTPLGPVKKLAPNLAAEFKRLQKQLDCVRNVTGEGRTCTETSKVRDKLDGLIAEIRTVPGLDNFLFRPTEAEVKTAAYGGTIVVINVAYRCDAILIKPTGVTSIELPDLSQANINEHESCFRRPHPSHGATEGQESGAEKNNPDPKLTMAEALAWLWTAVADPILTELGYTASPAPGTVWPRVWWVTTGMLASFPIHAAGLLAPDGKNSVLDRVVSSYSPSVKALIHARRFIVPQSKYFPLYQRAALIWSPAGKPLAGIEEEVKELKAVLDNYRHIDCINIKISSKESLKDYLKDCTIFHFAGHGISERGDPSKSKLLLPGSYSLRPGSDRLLPGSYSLLPGSDSLTVSDLLTLKLHLNPPFLATLSACETGDIGDRALGDEGIHLISAFQLAGFRHVIGSLWRATDGFGMAVYKNLHNEIASKGFSDQSVALSLHNAVLTARQFAWEQERFGSPNGGIGNPFLWASFVHVGI